MLRRALLAMLPLFSADSLEERRRRILVLTNRDRKKAGVAAVVESRQLTQAAQAKADDMVRRRYFAHSSPDGKTPWTFIAETGYRYRRAAENLASRYRNDEELQAGWMRSSGHRANILNGQFRETGIGIAGSYVVQMFAQPAESRR